MLLICYGLPSTYGQTSLDDSLLFYEFKYFKCDNDTGRQKILLKKINLYLNAGITNNNVFYEVKRVKIDNLKTGKADFLWNASLVAYLNNESAYAGFFNKEYEALTLDTSVTAKLLKILIYKYSDTSATNLEISRLTLKDTCFSHLSCFKAIAGYNRKHLNGYLIASAIVPGSGSVMNGYLLKGVFSLALVSASAYAVVKMVEYGLYLNAALWGTGVGLKFYAGNINLTERLFYKMEAKHKNKLSTDCEFHLQSILKKYPLILRLK